MFPASLLHFPGVSEGHQDPHLRAQGEMALVRPCRNPGLITHPRAPMSSWQDPACRAELHCPL